MLASSKDGILPIPVSFSGSRRPYRTRSDSRSRPRLKFDVLLTRARVTNLGLLLLASFATLSFLVNLRYFLFSSHRRPHDSFPTYAPYSILETLSRDKSLLGLDHLILVPGHAIWQGSSSEDILNENKWILESYQKGGGRVAAFVKHIETG